LLFELNLEMHRNRQRRIHRRLLFENPQGALGTDERRPGKSDVALDVSSELPPKN